ncbi:inorganic pyrophosphatase [Ceraceosorus bombacis]|uniref:Inorganic pyrophosphatase n=1 Tax=Ceraceosorus bombacis TaxID=401625 RepID=A0A0P1BPZ7_9BASI|nr:inorganic pyrophosphatase [Ceraceosorus bombacis]
MSDFKVRQVGAPNTLDYRVFFEDGQKKPISPFHDIPLFANEAKTVLNMVVEIPRWTNGKLEISKEETLNPIKQDVKKGKLRYVRNCFPHHGYIWNYGAFPQTWEDPSATHPDTKAKGDNDPLDVCEIGEQVAYTGQVKQVKVLGVMALLDEGETDWKVLVVDVNDPLASKLNDIEDVERHLPGLIRATNEWFRIYKIPDGKPENQFAFSGEAKNKRHLPGLIRATNEWFRIYKIPDGKPENQFAFSGEAKNKKYATEVIHECNEAWKRLVGGQADPAGVIHECNEAWKRLVGGQADPAGVSIVNSTQQGTKGFNDSSIGNVPAANPQPSGPIDPSIDKWFFISSSSI